MTHALRMAVVVLVVALSALASPAVAGEPPPPESEAALPPTVPGRQVVLDSRIVVAERQRQLKLSDFDQDEADIIREINRKPGS